ncbi:hypothetical protein GOP47_0012660 [Adiantum capillus-veneris]|uniref:Uncharacterized protein n=1 Tax=Adiantum capillus-veneris TaxID=13818 RepID=A0A9D4URJ2_ADICA|nr:hypothetical protein GOP47_0012660 [Adiantum capillus-veneris]
MERSGAAPSSQEAPSLLVTDCHGCHCSLIVLSRPQVGVILHFLGNPILLCHACLSFHLYIISVCFKKLELI